MIKCFMRLKQVPPGAVIRFRWGGYAVVSEYRTDNANHYDMYVDGSGEALHADGNEWVAVMDMQNIEAQLSFEEYEYPSDEVVEVVRTTSEKPIFGNALVDEDERHHIPGLKSTTLCGLEITARVRGLIPCDCPQCIAKAKEQI